MSKAHLDDVQHPQISGHVPSPFHAVYSRQLIVPSIASSLALGLPPTYRYCIANRFRAAIEAAAGAPVVTLPINKAQNEDEVSTSDGHAQPMATGTEEPVATASAPEAVPNKEHSQNKKQPKEQPAKAGDGGSAAAGEKKLSGAELKKRAKEEKAARRAQAKTTLASQGGGGGPGASGQQQQQQQQGGNKAKAKQDGGATGQQTGHQGQQQRAAAPKETKPAVPECFSHLSMARRIDMTQADKDVHPAVLVLGQHMSTFALSDSITRLEATLLAFKKVIDSYTTPHGATFSRHFTSHVLNPQIDYLTACRPMCFSMGNAIRWLKLQISKIDIDLPDIEAKKRLSESIDSFIHERITLANLVIAKAAADMVDDGDVVLTYAHHSLVERALLLAQAEGRQFSVVLVDDPYDRAAGLGLAKRLVAAGVPVAYASELGALRTNLRQATLVLVAAEAMFSNGAMYARAGTCDVAAAAHDLGVRLIALCETINFTERVSIDSLTYNEIDPERNTDVGFRLLFDTTRDRFISVVITELGNTSPTSVPAVLRKLEEL